jgi:hypothetical protein
MLLLCCWWTNILITEDMVFKEINIEFGRFVVQIFIFLNTGGKVYSWGIIFWTY